MKLFRVLVALFIVLPLLELWVLYRLGIRFGFFETIAALIVVGFVGATLAKREGLRVLGEWNRSAAEGRVPEEGVLSGVLSLGAAALFVLPGVISDVLGLCLLFPPTRRWIAGYVRRRFEESAASGEARVVTFDSFGAFGGFETRGGGAPRGMGRASHGARPHAGEVIDVVGEDVTDGAELDPARTLPRHGDGRRDDDPEP